MGDMRKIRDDKLFNYQTSKIYEQYSRICGSSDMRQPIILSKTEYNNFKIKNKEAFEETSFLEWGSSSSKLNYYLCPDMVYMGQNCINCKTACKQWWQMPFL